MRIYEVGSYWRISTLKDIAEFYSSNIFSLHYKEKYVHKFVSHLFALMLSYLFCFKYIGTYIVYVCCSYTYHLFYHIPSLNAGGQTILS